MNNSGMDFSLVRKSDMTVHSEMSVFR